jgi:hypothetical protein
MSMFMHHGGLSRGSAPCPDELYRLAAGPGLQRHGRPQFAAVSQVDVLDEGVDLARAARVEAEEDRMELSKASPHC